MFVWAERGRVCLRLLILFCGIGFARIMLSGRVRRRLSLTRLTRLWLTRFLMLLLRMRPGSGSGLLVLFRILKVLLLLPRGLSFCVLRAGLRAALWLRGVLFLRGLRFIPGHLMLGGEDGALSLLPRFWVACLLFCCLSAEGRFFLLL